jgi:NtrC-family two-component system sensor histidine kinase KinB
MPHADPFPERAPARARTEELRASGGTPAMSRTGRPQSRSAAVLRAVARLAALAAPLVGLLTLVGQVRGLAALKSLVAGFPATSPPSSLALMLGGLSLGLRLRSRPSLLSEVAAVTCALGVMAIGVTSLIQDVLEPDGGALSLLMRVLEGGRVELHRPSSLTSCCLLLLGGALALSGTPARRPTRDVLTVLALLGALLGFNGLLLGPLVGGSPLPFFTQYHMGLPTAFGLLLLGVGVLCARPEEGLMIRLTRDTLGGFLARRLVPVALLGPPLLGLALVLLHNAGAFHPEAKLPLFATLVSAASTALVLLSSRALDTLDARRQQATTALEASEARYRGLLETAPAPVLTVDSLGLLRFFNAEAERVFGYPREEVLGREVEVLLPEGLFGGHRLDASPGERALYGSRKDGSRVQLEVRLSLVPEGDGTSLLALLRDVTEREQFLAGVHRAREEAEMQRSLLRVVLDHTPVGVVFVDPVRGTVVANRVADTLFGAPMEDLMKGHYLARIRYPDGRPLTMDDLPSTRAAKTGKVVGPEEFLILQPDGRTVPVLGTAAPVTGPSDEPRGVVVSLQDLTLRHELDRLREEYVGLISHDLRSPLQVINLRAALLRRGLHERRLAREEGLTDSILRSVEWMSAMIEELLEGSRLEAKRQTLRREEKDLVRFLEEVLERDVAPDLRERFRLEVAGPMPPVWVDAARLERVLANLLGNAAKYSPPPLPVVVRARAQEGQVVVSVSDQGEGLSPEDAAHIFDKYYRTRHGSAADTKGLGAGHPRVSCAVSAAPPSAAASPRPSRWSAASARCHPRA